MHALIMRLQVTARLLRSRQVDRYLPISVINSRGRLRMVTLVGSVMFEFEGGGGGGGLAVRMLRPGSDHHILLSAV